MRSMTKKRSTLALVLTAAIWISGTQACLGPHARPTTSPQERFFDTAEAEYSGVRLVVFNPTAKRIKDVVVLRAERLIDIQNLTVIGVYHKGQTEDFDEARAYVRDQRLDWFKFHEVRVPIAPDELYRANALTPEIERIFRLSNGMIFTGGPDIPPELYGNKTSLLSIIEDPERHTLELSALFQLLGGDQDPGFKPLLDSRPNYPILAICLGAQSLNVAAGGTLIQDIWAEVYGLMSVEDIIGLGLEKWHNNPYARLHPGSDLSVNTLAPIVRAGRGRLWSELGLAPDDRPFTLSSHHQAISRLGRGLVLEASSPDGKIVEALSHERFPGVLAVQFHPEAQKLWDASLPYRLSPQETSPQAWRAVLESHPASFEFHRSLWAWFSSRLKSGR